MMRRSLAGRHDQAAVGIASKTGNRALNFIVAVHAERDQLDAEAGGSALHRAELTNAGEIPGRGIASAWG